MLKTKNKKLLFVYSVYKLYPLCHCPLGRHKIDAVSPLPMIRTLISTRLFHLFKVSELIKQMKLFTPKCFRSLICHFVTVLCHFLRLLNKNHKVCDNRNVFTESQKSKTKILFYKRLQGRTFPSLPLSDGSLLWFIVHSSSLCLSVSWSFFVRFFL